MASGDLVTYFSYYLLTYIPIEEIKYISNSLFI